MALKVWLPLNGNLKNQGLNQFIPKLQGELMSYTAGKIGQCATFTNDSSSYYPTVVTIPALELQELTVCLWIKPSAFTGTEQMFIREGLGYNGSGWAISTSPSANTFEISMGNVGSTLDFVYTPGQWYHLAMSHGSDHHYRFYINGTLYKEYINYVYDISYYDADGYISIGGRTHDGSYPYPFNGSLNDVRIYDKALSPKQIKEISKGLIVHYKLSTLGLPNLAKNTNTASIDTNICRLHLQTGGYTHTIEYDEYGIPCVKIIRDDVEHSGWSYLSYDNIDRNALTVSTTYTISMDVKATVNGTISLTGILNGNATNYMTNSVENINGTVVANQWNHLVFRCTTISDFSTITLGSQVLYWAVSAALRATGITIWVKNVKLEKGSQNTPWIPYTSDEKYEKLGYNNTRIRDCSGYGYNGTETVNISDTTDIARYITSSYFVTTNAYYTLPVLTTTGFANSYSFAWWSKHSNMEGHMAWGFSDGNRLNLYPTSSTFCLNTGDGSSNPFKDDSSVNVPFASYNGAWHHYVITGDGTKALLYIDGEKKGTAQTYKSITGTQIYLSGWDTGTSYSWGSAYLSDFRIYATALDADSVRQLYEASALIDNETNAYSFEFVEEV